MIPILLHFPVLRSFLPLEQFHLIGEFGCLLRERSAEWLPVLLDLKFHWLLLHWTPYLLTFLYLSKLPLEFHPTNYLKSLWVLLIFDEAREQKSILPH